MNEQIFTALQTDSTKTAIDSLQNISSLTFDMMKIVTVDCYGNGNSLMVTFTGLSVVFVSLFLIYLIFNLLSKLIYRPTKKNFG